MKRLLSLLSAIMFVATPSIGVVSCSIGKTVKETIASPIQASNFNLGKEISENWNGSSYKLSDLEMINNLTNQNLLFNDGISYKTLDDNSLIGTFNSSQYSIVNELNSKLQLGMKINVEQDNTNLDSAKTYNDLLNKLTANLNVDNLKNVEVSNVTGRYRISNQDEVFGLQGVQKIDAMLDGASYDDENLFQDGTYVKEITFKNLQSSQEYTVHQIVNLTNMNIFINNYKKYIDQIQSDYGFLNNDPLAKTLKIDTEDLKLWFSKEIDLFKAQQDSYYVSLALEGNALNNQMKSIMTNDLPNYINQQINQYNQRIFATTVKSLPNFQDIVKADIYPYSFWNDATKTITVSVSNNDKTTLKDGPLTDEQKNSIKINDEDNNIIKIDSVSYDSKNGTVSIIVDDKNAGILNNDIAPGNGTSPTKKVEITIDDQNDPNSQFDNTLSSTVLLNRNNRSSSFDPRITLDQLDWNHFDKKPRVNESFSIFEKDVENFINEQLSRYWGFKNPNVKFGSDISTPFNQPTITAKDYDSIWINNISNTISPYFTDSSVLPSFDTNILAQQGNYDESAFDTTVFNNQISNLRDNDWLLKIMNSNNSIHDLRSLVSSTYMDENNSTINVNSEEQQLEKQLPNNAKKQAILDNMKNNIENINYSNYKNDSSLFNADLNQTVYQIILTDSNYDAAYTLKFSLPNTK